MQPLVADLFTAGALAGVAKDVDAAVHAASSNDERSAELDHAVVDTFIEAFAGTGKPFVYTSGLWLHGNTGDIAATEKSPFAPLMVVSWRPAVEEKLADAKDMHTIRIRPGLVYDGGRGYIPMVLGPQDDGNGGKLVGHFGDGSNRWSVVHADDLGDLYALAVEKAPADSTYLATVDEPVRVRDASKVVANRFGATVQDWDPADAQRYWSVMVEALPARPGGDQRQSPYRTRLDPGAADSAGGARDQLIRPVTTCSGALGPRVCGL
ncbi:hypothetical protein ACIBH1_47975 [Nonomuraea sp. NPDC050663]|uniref:hypothetical protein n=1 Tax=Nonomuraea sp. NPDC050663 TaxID=3364370 RepID=UPI0037B96A38